MASVTAGRTGPHPIDASKGECVALLARAGGAGPVASQVASLVASLVAGPGQRRRLRVGASDPLFARLDVAGNLAFPLSRALDASERSRVTDDLSAAAGLEHLAGRRPRDLLPAERVRVLLARAFAAAQPLLLDDLFHGLSSGEREQLHVVLRRLIRQRASSVILVTTERAELLACGDRIGVVETGLPDAVRPVPAMLAAPGSAFAARALLEAELFAGRVGLDVDDETDIHLGCGATVPARLSEGVGPGDLCLVAVRPDQIAFAAVPAGDMGDRSIAATLIEVTEFGDHLRLRVRLADGTQAWVRRPSGSLTARDLSRALEPGGASLAWRSVNAVAYPHPDA